MPIPLKLKNKKTIVTVGLFEPKFKDAKVVKRTRSPVRVIHTPSSSLPAAVLAALKTHKDIGIKLALGVGDALPEGFIGLDNRHIKNPMSIQHPIKYAREKYPYPLPDGCAQFIAAGLVMEYLDPRDMGILKFFDELWRLLKYDGQLMVSTPNGGSALATNADPAIIRCYAENTFLYFAPLHDSNLYKVYQPRPWKLTKMTFQIDGLIEVGMQKLRWDRSYGEAY